MEVLQLAGGNRKADTKNDNINPRTTDNDDSLDLAVQVKEHRHTTTNGIMKQHGTRDY
jgi:hypothetical protein